MQRIQYTGLNYDKETDTFDIAGLRYHCTAHDCGYASRVIYS